MDQGELRNQLNKCVMLLTYMLGHAHPSCKTHKDDGQNIQQRHERTVWILFETGACPCILLVQSDE